MKNLLPKLLLSLTLVSTLPLLNASADTDKPCENSATQTASICAVTCSEPMESTCETIINTLKNAYKAIGNKDYNELEKYLDENCTTYDATTKKTVVGRKAIIESVKAKMEAEEKRLKTPAISFHIDHPFAKITGDKAVVTFVLKKEVGGANPATFENHVTDVFVRREGQWKKLHYCGRGWKRIN